jgi:enoyl-CoA hydratase/carnithine racemase
MNYETVLLDIAEGVATITLNRPQRMNSFNHAMTRELRAIWSAIRKDDVVRAVVLRAAPCAAFCTGVDVKEGWRSPGERDAPFDMEDPGEWLGPKSNRVWKPMIVAVSGMTAGGAFYWLNEADIVICSNNATFFDPHTTFGMVSAVEAIGAVGRIPILEVLRMVLLGNDERMSAETAKRISLVTEITTPEDLWSRADALARGIAAKPPAAIQGSIRAIWDAQSLPRAQAVSNALKYTQLGNPIGTAGIDRSKMKTPDWRLR